LVAEDGTVPHYCNPMLRKSITIAVSVNITLTKKTVDIKNLKCIIRSKLETWVFQ